jgi:1-acyl-sn-glycerol-3-phosphate acyltransferase
MLKENYRERKTGETMGNSLVRSAIVRWRIGLVRNVVNLLFALLTRREVYGRENLPQSGGYLLVFNQLSSFDTPLIFTLLNRTDLTGLVAANYRDSPIHRLFIEAAGGTWIRRGASDRTAIKTALEALEQGWVVGISPEGRRSPTKALIQGKPGPAFLATHANVPVVPIGLTNTENLAKSLKHLSRISLTIRIGEPFRLPPVRRENQKQQLLTNTDLLMCHIAALVPPKYRGIYADHEQLKALVDERTETAV